MLSATNGMELKLVFLFFLIPHILSYQIRVDPRIKTSVNNLQAKGTNNSIKFSQITNSTILQALPEAVIQSHANELISTSIILSVFATTFCILAIIINKTVMAIFKLNQRITHLESVCFG